MNGAARNSATDPYRDGISGQETRTAAVTDLASGNARAVATPRTPCRMITRLMRIAVDEQSTFHHPHSFCNWITSHYRVTAFKVEIEDKITGIIRDEKYEGWMIGIKYPKWQWLMKMYFKFVVWYFYRCLYHVENNFGKCWKIGEGIKGSWLKELEKDLRVRLFRGDALKFLHGP